MCTATSAGRHLVVGISSLALTQAEEQFLHRVQPAGVILFSRNIQDPDQVQALIASVRDRIAPTCTIWLDQEGGRVQRLRDPFTRFPSPWQWAVRAERQPERAIELARLAGQVCGMELATMGIGINCAPVLDIREPGANPVIGERAFGDTPQGVVVRAGAWLEGLQAQGVMAVGKHFPGHGAAQADSHQSLPTITGSRAELEQWEWVPFKALLARLPALMTAHLVASGLGEEPATWSRLLLQDILRQEWGYQGLVVSDALEMGALSGPLAERACRAVQAGCDIVLCCTGRLEDNAATLAGVTQAVDAMTGTQKERLDERIIQTLAPYCPAPGDWRALLRQPEYGRAREQLEAVVEENRQADPTESLH
ncbi:MAG: beta-N-acetylhexosaminidase [Magnetococcales bacterium]|nr:beta-N-acetylhexosaminidase [Magnetococcales bacterium]